MAFFKLLYLFILVSFVLFATTKPQDLHLTGSSCSLNETSPNSPYQLNLRTLLNYLSSNATTGKKEFYNTTVIGRNNRSGTVYGMFMCRGDITSQLCGQCVSNATQEFMSTNDQQGLYNYCSLSTDAMIMYDECRVRYSNRSFFSTVDLTSPFSCEFSNVSESLMGVLLATMNKTAEEAASSPILAKKYSTKQARVSGFQTIYCLAQCTPDLSPQDCRTCLNVMITQITPLCSGSGTPLQNPSCYIRYEFFPFYRPNRGPAPTELVPAATNSSNNKYSQGAGDDYVSHNCSSKDDTANSSAFRSNLRTLLFFLSSNATIKTGFYKTTVGDGIDRSNTINGLFMCRGDVSPGLCQLCVQNATERLLSSSECGSSKEAIIWYNHCMLRYSYRTFTSTGDETAPSFQVFNMANTNTTSNLQKFFTWTLANTLSDASRWTMNGITKNYGTSTAKLNDFQTIYALGQCTPDLDSGGCSTCLTNIFTYQVPWCCLASPEGKVFNPSCYIMFGLSKFYGNGGDDEDQAIIHASPPPAEKKKNKSQTMILIVVPTVVAGLLLLFGWHLLRKRKPRKSYKTVLRENFGDEGVTLEHLQFDLAIIEVATNNFSSENMIGKGGFGEVYKGILSDGRYIAVKRLSKSSKQGIIEFKNEVLLVTKFQHRNLVTFIGFCLKDQEKILIYEYVSNGSLDNLLFGAQQKKLLYWFQRFKIIKGIARGIHYLHEHSRPKIIHRDLKPSNVLLDENMNPKLSDFGVARVVEIDEDQEITNKIVGTRGYMSPEYVMFGHYSEKSDIFSFGVMILEIVTGKKNLGSYDPHCAASGLLSYVWRNWREGTPLSILDPKMAENYPKVEVTNCIHIGLLCVQDNPECRPPMVTIISYLDNHLFELPSPEEPAFFFHGTGRMDHNIAVARELVFGENFNGSTPSTSNEISISEFFPR